MIRQGAVSVGVLGFDDVNALDLTGPLEVFAAVRCGGQPAYTPFIVSATGRPFIAESGVTFSPTAGDPPTSFDTILIPGGAGLRRPDTLAYAKAWIRRQARTSRRVVSICTGAFGLAETGLLDNRPVTTHWRFAEQLQQDYPALNVKSEALYLKDDQFYTSAGITAGLDLALLLVDEDFGPRAATEAAKDLVMFLRRPGNQHQICQALVVQSQADRFADLIAWMAANPAADQSVPELSRIVGMSPRQFARRFQSRFGTTPAKFAQSLRLDLVRQRLAQPDCNLEALASQLGFASDDSLARSFQRRFGTRPRDFQRQARLRQTWPNNAGPAREAPEAGGGSRSAATNPTDCP